MAMHSVKTALITGSSGGLGLEFAKLAAADGYNLVLVARRQEVLEQLAAALRTDFGIQAFVLAIDLSQPGAAIQVCQFLASKQLQIDLLVNNAGFAIYGKLIETDLDQEQDLLRLNVMTLTELTKLLLPHMVQQKWGRILNVASVAAFLPGPLMATYYASKAYVLSFSQAINQEVQGTGVTVTTLCPGPIQTGFASRAQLRNSRAFYRQSMDVATVALSGYQAMQAGKSLAIPGWKNKMFTQITRIVPYAMLARLASVLNRPDA
jgi:short-subunit dehydrogenase